MPQRNSFDPAIPVFRVRCGGTKLKLRYVKIAEARGGNPTNIALEALTLHAAAEEGRLGLPNLDAKPAAPPAGKSRKKKGGTVSA